MEPQTYPLKKAALEKRQENINKKHAALDKAEAELKKEPQ